MVNDIHDLISPVSYQIVAIVILLLAYETVKEGLLGPLFSALVPAELTWTRGQLSLPVGFLARQLFLFWVFVFVVALTIGSRLLLKTAEGGARRASAHMHVHSSKLINTKVIITGHHQ